MRIRSIKPEFWSSEDIAALPWDTRLLFIGLWSYVDDNGVGRDVEKLIAADLFPLEDNPRDTLATVSRGLQHLSTAGHVTRYEVHGRRFLHINTWEKHQKIDRPAKERYKPPTCDDAVIRDTFATPSRDLRDTLATGAVEQRSRGTGEEETCSPATPSSEPAHLGSSRFDEFWTSYPRKVGKEAARKAWPKALKKAGHRQIIDGARQLASDPHFEAQFCPHPSKWLNEGRWDDPPLPSRSGGNRPTQTQVAAGVIQAGARLMELYPDEPKEIGR